MKKINRKMRMENKKKTSKRRIKVKCISLPEFTQEEDECIYHRLKDTSDLIKFINWVGGEEDEESK